MQLTRRISPFIVLLANETPMRKAIPSGFFLTMAVISIATLAHGAPLRNVPITITQPTGQVIRCYASGDEFFNWLHDGKGFTIVQDSNTGFYTYAVPSGGRSAASSFIVGVADPTISGLVAHVMPARPPAIERLSAFANGSPLNPGSITNAPRKGFLNNLAVFIRFSDDLEYFRGSTIYDTMFNSTSSGANSMRNYFGEASYGQLSISTSFYPTPSFGLVVSYQDSQPRAYYQPYSVSNPTGYPGGDSGVERMIREHTLLVNAVNSIGSQVPANLVIDGDGDGYVDNICFIIKGGPTGWSSLLWPHMWSLHNNVYINSKLVHTYNFQMETVLDSDGVGVLCHEMFHSLGAPDLYHYVDQLDIQPLYKWDLMDYNLNPPQHMTAYMKRQYGTWISDIPVIRVSGTYILNPVTSSTNNAYRINSPYSQNEYFMVEYRKKSGTFESLLPGEGLIIYRIVPYRGGQGNVDGPPDEVYLFRPDGTLSANGDPSRANFSSTVGRTSINDATNPSAFLFDGRPSGINISNVGAAGSTISFTVTIPTDTLPAPILNREPNISFGTANTISWKPGSAASSVAVEGDPGFGFASGTPAPGKQVNDPLPLLVSHSTYSGLATATAGAYARRTAAVYMPTPEEGGGLQTNIHASGVPQRMFDESFEFFFPGARWTLYGQPTWGKTTQNAHGGFASAWCAASETSPASGYADNMDAWMVYGPFSLADAANAQVDFWYRNSSETGLDFFQWFASTDNVNFYGYEASGDRSAWTPVTFNLAAVPGLGNFRSPDIAPF